MTEHYKTLPEHELLVRKSFIRNLNIWDWVFAALVFLGTVFVQTLSGVRMDIYETVILWVSAGIAVFWVGFSNLYAGLCHCAYCLLMLPSVCTEATSNRQKVFCCGIS